MTPAQRAAVLRRRTSLDAQVQAALTGKNAVMLDMTDLSTLYQANTFATPVTTTGQTVGFVADKAKSSVAIDVAGHTWTVITGDGALSVVGNQITITGATVLTRVARSGGNIPFSPGMAKMTVTATWSSATTVQYWLRGSPAGMSNGVSNTQYVPLNNSTFEAVEVASGTATFTINEFKYWEGNHATQSTAGFRPLLQTNNGKYAAQFDGTDDALILPNIAWTGGALNSFVASNIGASTKGVHIWRTADPAGGSWGVWQSGDSGVNWGSGVGSPISSVNGVIASPQNRNQLYLMMSGINSVIETTGITLSANSALQIGGYASPYALSGPVHRVLLVEGTLTAPQIALFRTWTGQGIGLNL